MLQSDVADERVLRVCEAAFPSVVVEPREFAVDEESRAAHVAHRVIRVADPREVQVANRVMGVETDQDVAVSDHEASWHGLRAMLPASTGWVPVSRSATYNRGTAQTQEPPEHHVLETNPEPFSPPIRIVASRKRRRTVAARLRSGVLELLVPALDASRVEREHWAEVMRSRSERRMQRSRPSDERLLQRARSLNHRHFDGTVALDLDRVCRDAAPVGKLHLHRWRDPHRQARRARFRTGCSTTCWCTRWRTSSTATTDRHFTKWRSAIRSPREREAT